MAEDAHRSAPANKGKSVTPLAITRGQLDGVVSCLQPEDPLASGDPDAIETHLQRRRDSSFAAPGIHESLVNTTVSAAGAIPAMRRESTRRHRGGPRVDG